MFGTVLVELNRINVAVPLRLTPFRDCRICDLFTCRIATDMRLSSSSDCMEVLGSHHCVILVAAVLFDVKLSLCAL